MKEVVRHFTSKLELGRGLKREVVLGRVQVP